MTQPRLRSKVLWVSIIAQLGTILILTGVVGVEGWTVVEGVAISILQILNLLGVINNPTDSVKW